MLWVGWLSGPGRLLRLLVWNDHGCLQLEDTGRVRTRCRVPRGISRKFEVSPTGSIPRREDPPWQVTKDKVEASRAKLRCGRGAPKARRPRTRVTSPRVKDQCDLHQVCSNQSSRDARVPPRRHERFRWRFRLVNEQHAPQPALLALPKLQPPIALTRKSTQ